MSGAATRVMIVEDEAAICLLLSDALQDAGFQVTDAMCPSEAFAALDADFSACRVLVTDVNVEVRGWGFGFARHARARNETLLVVYITGDSEADVVREGVPGSTVLPKPFTPIELVRHIHQRLADAA